jgi:hypothetical protein
MKKLFATLLVVPVLSLFILSGNVFSKACDGSKDSQKYLKTAQMNQPVPQQPQKQVTPGKPTPNMQKKQQPKTPGMMKKNKPGKPGQNGNMPGKKKPEKQKKGMF